MSGFRANTNWQCEPVHVQLKLQLLADDWLSVAMHRVKIALQLLQFSWQRLSVLLYNTSSSLPMPQFCSFLNLIVRLTGSWLGQFFSRTTSINFRRSGSLLLITSQEFRFPSVIKGNSFEMIFSANEQGRKR